MIYIYIREIQTILILLYIYQRYKEKSFSNHQIIHSLLSDLILDLRLGFVCLLLLLQLRTDLCQQKVCIGNKPRLNVLQITNG